MHARDWAAVVAVAMIASGCGVTGVPGTLHTSGYGGWNRHGGTPPASGVSDYVRSQTAETSATGWYSGVRNWSAYYPGAGPYWTPYLPPLYANDTGAPFTPAYTFGASLGYPFSPWRVF